MPPAAERLQGEPAMGEVNPVTVALHRGDLP